MKKTSGISILVSAAVLAGLCGCASNSSQTSQTTAQTDPAQQRPPKPKKHKGPLQDRLALGMTMDQVKAACGNPQKETMNNDGSSVWEYSSVMYPTWNPIDDWGAKIHYVTVFFDSYGKVTSWSSSSANSNGSPF